MNTEGAVAALEEAVARQVALGDERLEEAALTLLGALRPALERLSLTLAEQAAEEVTAQLVDSRARVVVEGGEPQLVVEPTDAGSDPPRFDDLEARLTLRLPAALKELIEESAGEAGDSVNTHVVETLHRSLQRARRSSGRRLSGTIET